MDSNSENFNSLLANSYILKNDSADPDSNLFNDINFHTNSFALKEAKTFLANSNTHFICYTL